MSKLYSLVLSDDEAGTVERRAEGFGMSVPDYLLRCALATGYVWGGRPVVVPLPTNAASGGVTVRRVPVHGEATPPTA